jgi:hypothetical protein
MPPAGLANGFLSPMAPAECEARALSTFRSCTRPSEQPEATPNGHGVTRQGNLGRRKVFVRWMGQGRDARKTPTKMTGV